MRASVVAAALPLLMACSGGDRGSATGAASTRSPPTVDDTASSQRAEQPLTTTTAQPTPNVLVDVRIGDHEGFERVTLEFSGATVPTYRVAQADAPNSYECVQPEIAGSSFLNVTMPSSYQGGDPTLPFPGSFNPDRAVSIPEAQRVTEVQVTCDFEGSCSS